MYECKRQSIQQLCALVRTYVMAQEGTREYLASIPKGRGFVYAYANQLYNRVKTEGRTKYLKCSKVGCDGSAKTVGDLFFLGVCTYQFDFVNT